MTHSGGLAGAREQCGPRPMAIWVILKYGIFGRPPGNQQAHVRRRDFKDLLSSQLTGA